MSDVADGEVRTTENKKTTFRNIEQASVRMKIKRFEDISEKIKCVVGNGRCATHNCKLVREVVMRRTSQ